MNDRTDDARAAENPADFALESFVPYRLSLLSNTVSEGIAATYRDAHGLSVTEWRVVAILGRFAGLTASDVMARGAMDKVAVSRAVGRLESRDLVRRTAHASDGRRMVLKLSRAGVRLFNQVVPRARDYERRLLEALSGGERAELDRLLDKLQRGADALDGGDDLTA